ncbi:conserved Plasmodium protein, unknown function [Plasmodium vinckei lentum]|uniref:Generative cell specific-1/HAP2 domain-containing protein n=1 Tax=Plasmodium vinckei lentum TaxID=138297 RepID=A0A6V7S0U2_PLAVN|nr:conserved Plasmodium protein, unknown function [Plasmodium vinckei lentum]
MHTCVYWLFVVVFFLFQKVSILRATENLILPNEDNSYTLYFKNKQRYVIRRSEESAYKNFLLYVEEIYKSTVIYPIKYVYDVPLGYFENLISYKKEDIKNKSLKEFCESQKQLYENKDGNQVCFCCYCTHPSLFPLYSQLKYKRKKLLCNKKDSNKDVILTLSCLKKQEEEYHGFYIQPSSNFFMLNVTMQQFDLNNELFINRNIKPPLDRKTYLLDSSTFKIDDEVFNIKIDFDVEKTHQGSSIEGNYIFMDAGMFKEKINIEDTFIDDEILGKSVIVEPNNLNDKGDSELVNTSNEKNGKEIAMQYERKMDVDKKWNDICHNNNKEFIECVKNNFYIGLEKKAHNFMDIRSYNNEKLNIYYDDSTKGESISFNHSLSNCYDFNNILERDCTIYMSIWNKEDIDKEINVFLNCEEQIVRDINSIKKKVYLYKKCETTVTIKFEPIINLSTTKCYIEITKEVSKIVEKERKGNIRENAKDNLEKNKTDQNEYHLFDANETENENQTNGMKITMNSPIVFDIDNKIGQHYLKNVDIIEGPIYIPLTYKQMFNIYATAKNIIILILLFIFFTVIIIPSFPFFKYIISIKLFHNLRMNRIILFWKVQDIYDEIKWGLYIWIKTGEKGWGNLKIFCLFIFRKFPNFLKFRKVEDLVNHIWETRHEDIVKRDSEQKIKYEKRNIDKQNLVKHRNKKLIEYEKLFLKELHKGHEKKTDERKKKKKKLKNRKEIKIQETDKQCHQKGERNKNRKQSQSKKSEKKHEQNELEKREKMSLSSIKDYVDLEGNYVCTDSSNKLGNTDENDKTCKDNKKNNAYINKKRRKRKSKQKSKATNPYNTNEYYINEDEVNLSCDK